MMKCCTIFLLLLPLTAAAGKVDFSREILPVLSDNCFYCHGPDAKHRKADLRLDDETGAKEPHDGPAAIVAGQSSQSGLMARVLSKDPEELMPPPDSHKKLTPAQIETLRRWIDEGAVWGEHWAFAPLTKPGVPADAAHPIDAFIRHRLATESLQPSPEADKATLLRRISLDLTGLPPSPELQQAMTKEGYDAVVDQLLASPAFGERMAWDWMDAARYADTNGYQGDNERTMWPWRDWVVKAYNENLPWDQFTTWQLAGDLLPNATQEQVLATGFLRNHPINGEGGRIAEENRVDYVMDMAETTGTVWMALTMNCCRCHDHKFDPLLQRDYYSLFAFFNQTPIDGSGGNPQTPPVLAVMAEDQHLRSQTLGKELTELDAQIGRRREEMKAGQPAWEAATLATPAKDDWQTLTPLSHKAEHQTLTAQPDQSILASGENPANDGYTLTMHPGQGSFTAIRLDALLQDGLGRSGSGNFVLTNFTVASDKPAKIIKAEATYEQGDLKIANAIDADPRSGWAVYEGRTIDRDHAGVFHFQEPIACTQDTILTIVMRFDSQHANHNLRHFRLSLTQSPTPGIQSIQETLRQALSVAPDQRNDEQKKRIVTSWEATDAPLQKLLADRTRVANEQSAIENAAAKVMVMADRPERRKSFILDHGIYTKETTEVTAATPVKLAALPPGAPDNRLGLARWITAPENPLPARVAVNRYWQMLFGIGLVKTAEDFGVQAEFPKHPELLDWLAAEFRESGYNVKHMIRLIVTSATYRQSSRTSAELHERDPDNRLLARGARFRMPSWMLRDQALAASGLLVRTLGGAPVKPYQPAGVWEEATFGNVKYEQAKGDALHRRSLYTFWRRIVGPTNFFDSQSRSVCTVKPTRTNTPLHALTTLNDPTFVEAARVLAHRALRHDSSPTVRLQFLFQQILGRNPLDQESSVLLAGMDRTRQQFLVDPKQAASLLAQGESQPDATGLDPHDYAAWTVLALTILNLDETVTRE